ncbi:S8 family serine peptidase [Glaciecola sp. MH2013]|uniref:S8 family serine peptidase n=1 Tax=Glaciecola sp. MH2013 TaxID=2785524 RepID=UPI00189EE43B|nr:S8 family serine peptidase [Glaciecola sp. MH2013]MBF7072775.1 S8 family serine peptidase [Glaciecola sp. MH2013]
MFQRTSLAIIVALACGSVYSVSSATTHLTELDDNKVLSNALAKKKIYAKPAYLNSAKFTFAEGNRNLPQTYIIHLNDAPVALYEGGTEGLMSTSPRGGKLNVKSPAVASYRDYVGSKQKSFIKSAQQIVPGFKAIHTYSLAFNGMAAKLSQNDAAKIAELPYVLKVEPDTRYKLDTDTGPELIGAPRVWSGQALSSGVGNYGEGVVVGIIDSGINTDHASFADIAGDGFDHTNPLGAGNYLGDCAGEFAALCNDKLIGVYSYDVITSTYTDTEVFPADLPQNGEDYGGHGTHVAGTAIGNILLNVAESLPEFDAEESSGIETGFTFPRISGVAPRANVISYQVCWGGRSDAGDTYGDCTGSAINAAIEDAIQDQVDVINYSISGGGQPWNSSTELAFLAARNAGIFVATSAGNSGPGAATTSKHAPWYTAVAAAEHGRFISFDKSIGSFTGGDSSLADIDGVSNSGTITAPIVYAGDYTNPNDPDNDSAQCLEPFPAGTFSGEIVVCDRGSIARIQKAVNVRDGGAGGYVLANLTGSQATNIVGDSYVIPGIHINASNGDALKAWLATGADHRATITASSGELSVDQNRVDVLAGFSSKGPNSSISTLSPTIGGPGVGIYAAYADQQFGHDGHEPSAGDFNYLSGTSMSSPHIAGAAALVKAVHPTWTPDNIRSALAMTASRTVKKEDGSTSADWFDSGSGRVQVDLAVETGLVMSETASNYTNANPELEGEPRSLNLPSITDNNCVQSCSWERTFTAVKDGTWAVSSEVITSGLELSISPSSFSLNAGESQTILVSIDASAVTNSDWHFAAVNLTANGQPDLHLPVSVLPFAGNIPADLTLNARRSADSLLLEDFDVLTQTDFSATTFGFAKATEVNAEIEQDSTPNDLFDDLSDGIDLYEITSTAETLQIVANVADSSADDIDLFMAFDANNNGELEESEIILQSTTFGAIETVDLREPSVGRYWLVVQSYTSSSPGATDSYQLYYSAVTNSDSDISLTADVPSAVSSGSAFDMRMNWDLGAASADDRFYGVVGFGSAERPSGVQTTFVRVDRKENDVQLSAESSSIVLGEASSFNISVLATDSPESRNYDITLPIPDGFSLVSSSVSNGGAISDSNVSWSVTRDPSSNIDEVLSFDLIPESDLTGNAFVFSVTSDVTNIDAAQEELSELSSPLLLDVPPTILINGEESVTVEIFETLSGVLTANAEDANGDEVSVTWQQISGPDISISDSTAAEITYTVPNVESQTSAVLQATVTDATGNTDTATATIVINNNDAPTITVNAPSTVVGGSTFTVSVSTSDPENDDVIVTIDGVERNSVTRSAPAGPTSFTMQVVANDGINSVSQSVTISVTAAPSSGGSTGSDSSSDSSGGGGSSNWLLLALLPLIYWRRNNK